MKHFICSDWKPARFEKLYHLNIVISMADSQEKRKRANRDCYYYGDFYQKKKAITKVWHEDDF